MLHVLRRLSGCLVLGLSCLAARPAAAQDSTLTRLSHRHQYALAASADGSQFSGAGWDRLRADILRSQFVLLGEDHGIAQIPQFAAAVAREFKPAMYVGEVDPYVAQKVTELAAKAGEPTAYARQYPGALCFAAIAEEFEFIRSVQQQHARIVGIDQVFAAAAVPFYTQLASQVSSKAAQGYLRREAARYQAQDRLNLQQQKPYYALTKQTPGSIDSLLRYTKNEQPAVQKMAQDYAASYHIYTDQGGNHQRRLNLMRRNLLRELAAYQTPAGLATPPVLVKLGGVHLARGLSPIGFGEFYDVGNLVQNLADVQDKKSLHILILGKQGRKLATLNPANTEKLSVPYTEADYDADVPVKLFTDQVSGPAWSVFDLRPLRTALTDGKLHVASQALERTILGYDYLVVIPETTASRPI